MAVKWNAGDYALGALLGLTLLFSFAKVMLPIIQNATADISVLNIPLASLFASDGVIVLLVVGSMIVYVAKSVGMKK